MSGDARNKSMRENGRLIQSHRLQLIQRKPNAKAIHLDCVKDDIVYRWQRGIEEQRLASTLGVPRKHIEEILHERFGFRGPNGDPPKRGNVVPLKKVA